MKILFYINSIRCGGAERVITNLANLFSKNGYECVLVTSFYATEEYELSETVDRKALCDKKIEANFFKRNIYLSKQLRKFIKEEKPNVIISFMAEANFRALIASIGIQVKTVISVRNDPRKEYPTRLFRLLAKTLYKKADGIVFQTEEAKRWFPQSVQGKSIVILNPVDKNFYNVSYKDLRKDIVTTGRLVPQKNHKMLIEAYAKISNLVNDNLYIYGEGELRNELELMVKKLGLEDRVFLPGIVEDVANTIKAAKMFVLSSDYEGLPNALMEAMALGIPVISTDCPCGGARMLLADIDENLLVKINDAEQLAESMKRLLFSSEKLQEIGTTVKMRAEMFSSERIFCVWKEYIEAV